MTAPSLADARCGDCGSPDVVAIRVGQDSVRRGAVDLFTRADPLTKRGTPDRFWCLACWPVVRASNAAHRAAAS